MRRALWTGLGIATIALAGACAPAAPPPPAGLTPDEMVAAANALDDRFQDAFNRADVDALMATYWNSPNLVSFGPDGMGTRGWEACKAAAQAMFPAMPGAQLEFLSKNNEVQGDVVLGWGTWRITIPGDPSPTVLEGRFSDVKAMRDGQWVYVMDHASVPLPPPPAK